MAKEQKAELDQLEEMLSYEDILLYRKLANAAVKIKKEKDKNTSYFSSWFGSAEKVSTSPPHPTAQACA